MEANAYPKPVSSYVLKNEKGIFTDITAQFAPDLKNIGLVCDALWTDYDNDGWQDLMLAGEWMPLTILKNNQGKKLEKIDSKGLSDKTGFWNSLTAGDFDNDGDMDYIAGNLGINTLNQASDQYPVSVYAKDFNNDGIYDAIPTVFYKDDEGKRKEVTFHGRDDLAKQMNTVRKKFDNYNKFAIGGINDILSEDDLKDALVIKANYLKTSYIENLGDGNFTITPLPLQVQTAPIFGMLVEDFDADGNLDVLMVGNDFSNEVSVGRFDAFNGMMLKGKGNGNFAPQTLPQTDFCVGGDAKALIRVTNPMGNPIIMASQNRADLKVFEVNKSLQTKALQTNDAVVIELLKNGKKRRTEIGYGTSFLSQSSRSILLSPNVKSVEVIDYQGKKRGL